MQWTLQVIFFATVLPVVNHTSLDTKRMSTMENWGNSNLSTPVTALSPPCQKNMMSSVVYPSVSRSGERRKSNLNHRSVMKCQPLNLTMFLFKAFLKIKDKECRSIRHAKRLFLATIGCIKVIESWATNSEHVPNCTDVYLPEKLIFNILPFIVAHTALWTKTDSYNFRHK